MARTQTITYLVGHVLWTCRVIAVVAIVLSAGRQASAATTCTFVVDAATGATILRTGDRCETPFTPASTFKIPLSLIGYHSGIFQDADRPGWPYKDEYQTWNEDWKVTTTPRTWLRDSVVRAAVAQAPAPRRPAGYRDIISRKVGQLRGLGVELVFGSDEGSFGMTAAQATWRELDAWVRHLDVDPMTAIRKATLDAAKYLGADRETGSVTEGKYADVIAVAGNPLVHIDVLRTPAVVIKHGRRYR